MKRRLRLSHLVVLASLVVSVQTAQPPPIEITDSGNQAVLLSWPEGPESFVLETALALSQNTSWNLLNTNAPIQNGRRSVAVTITASQQYFRLRGGQGAPTLTTIVETSPLQGESGVNRETIIRFNRPLPFTAQLDHDTFYAEFGGRKLLSRVEVSSDRRSATLFYQEPLPAGARILARFIGQNLTNSTELATDPDDNGEPGGSVLIEFDTMSTSVVPRTAVIGHVYASDPVQAGNIQTNRPLRGVLITVDGAEESVRTQTDQNGFFKLEPCPVGRFFVHIDGRPAVGSAWPNGAYYPFIGKTFEALAGRTNNLAGGSGEIFLPLIKAGTLQPVSPTQPTTITFPPDVLTQNPALNGVTVTVPANALLSDTGVRGGSVGIAPVAPDRIPSPLPAGLQFPLVITIQTDGPSNFDTPVPVRFPNLPDPLTGQRLAPGEKTWLWSFNHDTGRWEPQGTMTISADGLFAVSDPGTGVRQPGWHGVNPGSEPEFPSYPPMEIRKPRPPCVPLTPEQIRANAEADLDCFGQVIPFFNAISTLIAASGEITDLVSALQTLMSGNVVESLQAACEAIFLTKGLVESAGEGLDFAANKAALAQVLACELQVLKNNLLLACQISTCLKRNSDTTTLCEDIFLKVDLIEALIGDAESFSEDPTEFSKAKLAEGVEAACGFLDDLGGAAAFSLRAATPVDPATLQQIRAAAQPALDEVLRLQRIVNELRPFDQDFAAILDLNQEMMEQLYTPIWAEFGLYRNAYYRLAYGQVELRGRSTSLGQFELPLLTPNVEYTFEIYDPLLNIVAAVTNRSAAGGQTTRIPDPIWLYPGLTDLSGDTDADGLTDKAERVIGTRIDNKDSDADGITDFAEVSEGLDPLGGLNLPVGIIATVDLPGEAYGVRHEAGKAYVATGTHGLAIVDVTKIDGPVLLGQIDLPGLNVQLAVSEANKTVAIISLPERIIGND